MKQECVTGACGVRNDFFEEVTLKAPRRDGAWWPVCLEHSKQEGRCLREAGERGREQRTVGTGTGFYSKSNRNP